MSLMKTYPTWYKGEVLATERGWVATQNNEVLVAIGNLKTKLSLENSEVTQNIVGSQETFPVIQQAVIEPVTELVMPVIVSEPTKEIMETIKEKKTYAPRKPKVIGEVTEVVIDPTQRIIGEVVEYNLDNDDKVISE